MNAMKQAKINGGASSQVPTVGLPIMDEPFLLMQRTLAPYFMNGNLRGFESDLLMNLLMKSFTMIVLCSPWRSFLKRWRLR